MKQVLILSETAEDLEIGRDFYDSQEIGIGDYFVDSLLSDITSLRLFSGIHPLHFGYHRMLASRFPFGIYYDNSGDLVRVIAVLDLRKSPLWLRSQISIR